MDKLKRMKQIRYSVACTIVLLIGTIAFYVYNNYLLCNTYTFTIFYDERLSKQTRDEISQHIFSCNLKNPAKIVSMLEQNFSFLKKIEVRCMPTGTIQIDLKSYTPEYIVNDALIVGKNRECYRQTIFTKEACQACPKIYITHLDTHMPKTIYNTISKLDLELFTHFILEWIDSYTIWLHDKNIAHRAILTSADTIEEVITRYKKIPKFERIKSDNYYVLDMRFSDQIVLYQNMEDKHVSSTIRTTHC